jgi:ADP-ribose pyrophosphatase
MISVWKVISRSEAYKKYSRKIEEVIFELPNGEQADFYIKKEGPAAAVLALTDDNEVILTRQFRVGPLKVLDELPGGFVDDGESGIAAMKRELLEETGYEGELELVGSCLDDAYSTMERFCYVAKHCKKVAEPQQTDTEQIEVVTIPLEKFRELLRSGQMTDVEVGYLGLDYLNLL